MLKYFRLPFAILGNRAAVDDDDPGTGVVNYETGYPPPYQLAKTDPSSRNIERDKMNEIFYDITQELQLLQAHGVPDFITTVLNGGTPHAYAVGDRVRYDAGSGPRVYESLVAANVDLPTVAASWRPVYAGMPYAAAAGTANALTAAFVPALVAVRNGDPFVLRHAAANTGGVTLAVDGGSALPVVKGSDTALTASDIPGAGSYGLYVYDATLNKFVLLNPATGVYGVSSIGGSTRGLLVRTNTGAPLTTVDISAAEVVLRNGAGAAVRLAAVAASANITLSGAGGLDTGVEVADQWYAIWAIYNPTTGTFAALLSTSSTAPVLPSGYTFSALVGFVRNAGGNFRAFTQRGSRYVYKTSIAALTAGTATVLTAVDLGPYVPVNAVAVDMLLNKNSPAVAGESLARVFNRNDATSGQAAALAFSAGSVQGGYNGTNFPLDWPDSSPNIWYVNSNGSLTIIINGFTLADGGALG